VPRCSAVRMRSRPEQTQRGCEVTSSGPRVLLAAALATQPPAAALASAADRLTQPIHAMDHASDHADMAATMELPLTRMVAGTRWRLCSLSASVCFRPSYLS
jgi:hypothetical protein